MSLELARKVIEGIDPLKFAYENYGGVKEKNRVKWLTLDSEYKVNIIELGQHGHLGLNGSKASLLSLEKAFGQCVVGHAHTAAIWRGVFRVGTSTKRMEYQKGPSSWTQTHCLVYKNGQRQLINFIDGEFYINS